MCVCVRVCDGVRACVRAYVRARVRACVCVCVCVCVYYLFSSIVAFVTVVFFVNIPVLEASCAFSNEY